MSSVSEISFFSPVYPDIGGKPQENEKMRWLGRIVEWYFDVGQQSYRILPDKVPGKSIPIEPSSKKRSSIAAARRITGIVLKIISYITLAIPFLMLLGKLVYRAENQFLLQKPLSREQLSKYLATAKKLIETNSLSEKIKEVDFQKTRGILSSLDILHEIQTCTQELSLVLSRSFVSLSDVDKNTFWRAYDVLALHLENLKKKIENNRDDLIITMGIFQEGLEEKFNLAGDRSFEIAEGIWSDLKGLDQLINTFKDPLKARQIGNNWIVEKDKRLLKDDFINRVSDIIVPKEILNLGATCFMNSSIQALIGNPVFRRRIKQNYLPIYETIKNEMRGHFEKVMHDGHLLFQNKTDSIVNFVFDTWEALSLEKLERLRDNTDATRTSKPVKKWLKNYTSEEAEHIQKISNINFPDYVRIRGVMETFRAFIKKYEKPRTKSSDFKNLTISLRKKLFDAKLMEQGNNGEGLLWQQDPIHFVGFVLKAIGASVLYTHKQVAFIDGLKPGESTQSCELIQIPINGKKTSFSELIHETVKEEVCGGNTFTGAQDTRTFNDQNDNNIKVTEWKSKMSIRGAPPEHLQFQILRFTNNLKKIETPVEFDRLEVDLSEMFGIDPMQKAFYRLKSCVIHNGTLQSGHYYSVMEKGGGWFKCDDSSITLLANPREELSKGYIYFLERIEAQLKVY